MSHFPYSRLLCLSQKEILLPMRAQEQAAPELQRELSRQGQLLPGLAWELLQQV
jgi:hypothetical protein